MKNLLILLSILSLQVFSNELPEGIFENYQVVTGQLFPTNREQNFTKHVNDYSGTYTEYKTMINSDYRYKFSRILGNDTVEFGSVYSKNNSNNNYNMIMMNQSPINLLVSNNTSKKIDFFNADSVVMLMDDSVFTYCKDYSNYGMWYNINTTSSKINASPKFVKIHNGWVYYILNSNLYRINSTIYQQPDPILENIIGYNFDYNGKLWYTTTNALNNCDPDGSNKNLNIKTGSHLSNNCFIVDPIDTTFIYSYKYPSQYSCYPYWDKNNVIRQIANIPNSTVSDSISNFYFNNKQVYFNLYSTVDQKYNVYKIDVENKNLVRYASSKTYMIMKGHRITYGVGDTTYFYNDELVKNNVPEFTSAPITSFPEGSSYRYHIKVKDLENDPVTISVKYLAQYRGEDVNLNEYQNNNGLINLDSHFSFDNDSITSNQFSFGSYNMSYFVIIQAKDYQDSVTQMFKLTISDVVDTPYFYSVPVDTIINEKSTFKYDVDIKQMCYDPDTFTYSLINAPLNMKFAKTTIHGTVDVLHSINTITWTPYRITGTENISVPVTIKVSNTAGIISYQSFNIKVINENDAPIITTTPSVDANENIKYEQSFTATDLDNDYLVWSVSSKPSWLTFSMFNGIPKLSGIPTSENINNLYTVSVRVSDGIQESILTYQILVSNTNDGPIVKTIPNDTIIEGSTYSETIIATDLDNDSLSYSIVQAPVSKTMKLTNNVITWKPSCQDTGLNEVRVKVCDGTSSSFKSFFLTVKKNKAPVFQTKDSTITIEYHHAFFLKFKAIDPDSTKISYSYVSKYESVCFTVDTLKVTVDKNLNDTILVIATDSTDSDTMKVIVNLLVKTSIINSMNIPLKNNVTIMKNQIKVALTKNSLVKVTMFDLQGKLIYSHNEMMTQGYHNIQMSNVSSKKYIMKIQFDTFQKTTSIVQF